MQKVKKCSEFRVKALRDIETIRLLASGFGISLSLTCTLCTYLSIKRTRTRKTSLLPSYLYIKQRAPTEDTQQHSRLEG